MRCLTEYAPLSGISKLVSHFIKNPKRYCTIQDVLTFRVLHNQSDCNGADSAHSAADISEVSETIVAHL